MHTTTNKKVNQEQLAALQEFVAKHVEYYDVQCELVDHMANGIEAAWQEDETISFNEAFRNEIKKFGVSGFRRIAEEREIALKKRYNKIIFKHLLSFFKLPRIIGSLLAMYAVFLLFTNYSEVLLGVTNKIIVAAISIMIGLMLFKKYRQQKSGRKFIFKEYIFNYGVSSVFMQIPLNLIIFSPRSVGGYYAVAYSVLFVVLLLYLYIVVVYIPKNADKYLNEVYPAYELMQQA